MVHVSFTDSDDNQVDIVRTDLGVELNTTGTYLCIAQNAVGSASRTVQVRVIGICINFFRTSNVINFSGLLLYTFF